MEKEIETELCRTDLLATLLTLDPTSSWQPPKDGDKCHNIAHFPPLNILLVHDIGQIRLEVREQGDPSMWSEKFSSPGTAGWIMDLEGQMGDSSNTTHSWILLSVP